MKHLVIRSVAKSPQSRQIVNDDNPEVLSDGTRVKREAGVLIPYMLSEEAHFSEPFLARLLVGLGGTHPLLVFADFCERSTFVDGGKKQYLGYSNPDKSCSNNGWVPLNSNSIPQVGHLLLCPANPLLDAVNIVDYDYTFVVQFAPARCILTYDGRGA